MDYRVEELAVACGIKVDTVRFYQGKGLIPPPERRGRSAIYGEVHLVRIRQIRSLLEQGFSLAQIGRLPAPDAAPGSQAVVSSSEANLLAAVAQESVGEAPLTRAQLVAEAGIPDELIGAAEKAGLLEPIHGRGEAHYAVADVEMLRSGLALIGAGFPLAETLELATRHAQNIDSLCDLGIDLFDDHIRKDQDNREDPEAVASAFQELLPKVTRLVALHFQRTLMNRAIERLRAKGEGPALEVALDAVAAARTSVLPSIPAAPTRPAAAGDPEE